MNDFFERAELLWLVANCGGGGEQIPEVVENNESPVLFKNKTGLSLF